MKDCYHCGNPPDCESGYYPIVVFYIIVAFHKVKKFFKKLFK